MLCLLLAAGVATWASTDDPVAPTAYPVQVSQALADLERAVRARDVDAARALAPTDDTVTADRLAALVDNATALRVRDFSLRLVDVDGAESTVAATWRFAGFDRTPASADVSVGLRDDGERVALTSLGGDGQISPLWLSGPVEVRRTPRTLVVVDGTAAEADRYAARAQAAVPVVRRVLPQWDRGLVVEVPATGTALETTLAAEPGTYDQIAAVTTSEDGTTGSDAPVHVFVNPDVFGTLEDTGAQVVMSHEVTHVATGAWTSRLPLWLLEGFADYVALRDVDLPVESAAAQALAEVRRDGPPRALPDAADFGSGAAELGATYESSWLACRLLAADAGEAALVSFYRAVDGGEPLPATFEASFGRSVRTFTAQWRAHLSQLAK